MELNLIAGGTVEVSDQTFGREFNEALIHQVVTAYMAGARQGREARRRVLKSLVVVASPGARRELVAHVQDQHARQFGAVVA